MKRHFKIALIFLISIGLQKKTHSQTVIDYSAFSTTQCNAFYPSASVNSITNTTTCGTVIYDNVNHAIELDTRAENNIYKGTEYKLGYNFKQGYSYTIKINAWCNTPTYPVSTSKMRVDFNNASNGSGAFCNGVESFNTTSSLTSNNNLQLNPGVFSDFTFQYNSLSVAQGFLYVGGFLPYINGTATSWILIKKITITESVPLPSFALTSSPTSIVCGNTTPVIFTATGSNIPNGATVSYNWNLGVSNGWNYNGSAAPSNIVTGATNILTLTPNCGSALSNVSVTGTVNSTPYNSNSVAISVTQPSLSITGGSSLCSGSSAYTINNVPCNAVVTNWAATPSGIVSVSASSNTATITKTGNGLVTLSADVTNLCGGIVHLTKQVTVGSYSPSDFPITGETSMCSNTLTTYSTNNLVGATDYNWIIPAPALSSGWSIYTGQGTPVLTVITGSASTALKLKVSNACTTGIVPSTTFVTVNPCGNFMFTISPNPATNTITIQQKPSTAKEASQNNITITHITIFDNLGNIKKQTKYSVLTKQASIDVNGLKSGIYFIEISNGSISERQQLVVQH